MNSEAFPNGTRAPQLRVLYACLFVQMVGYGSTLIFLPYHLQRIHALASSSPETVAFQCYQSKRQRAASANIARRYLPWWLRMRNRHVRETIEAILGALRTIAKKRLRAP